MVRPEWHLLKPRHSCEGRNLLSRAFRHFRGQYTYYNLTAI